MPVEPIKTEDLYVLNHCTKYLARINTDDRHNYIDRLELYGPSAPDTDILDPTQQDNKNDFQKQNVKDFRATDTHLIRGLVTAGDWTGLFVRLSYRGGPDSKLSQLANHKLKDKIKLFLKVNNGNSAIVTVPYNETSDRYEVEIWGYPGNDLRNLFNLSPKAKSAFDPGHSLIIMLLDWGILTVLTPNSTIYKILVLMPFN